MSDSVNLSNDFDLYSWEEGGDSFCIRPKADGPVVRVRDAEGRMLTASEEAPVRQLLRLAAENAELRGMLEEVVDLICEFDDGECYAPMGRELETRIRQALEKGDDGDK